MPRRHALIAMLILAAAPLLSSGAAAGPAGFAFLEIPAGARASALGGAFSSMGRDVEAAFWNPAGLAGVEGVQATGAHFELIDGLRHAQFAVAGEVLGGGLSGSLRALYSEPIDERDEFGNLVGTFGSHDLEFALGYGAPLAPGIDAGITAQVVRERIANNSATTYAFGGGATWQPAGWQNLRLGLSAHNLGPATHYTFDGVEGSPVDLPVAVQGGASYAHPVGFGMQLSGAVEGRFTRGRSGVAMFGGELLTQAGAAVRAGFRANDDAQSLSFGAGYTLEGLRLDYAYVPFRFELGDTHRFAFTAQF